MTASADPTARARPSGRLRALGAAAVLAVLLAAEGCAGLGDGRGPAGADAADVTRVVAIPGMVQRDPHEHVEGHGASAFIED
jgi:hypothetical protein